MIQVGKYNYLVFIPLYFCKKIELVVSALNDPLTVEKTIHTEFLTYLQNKLFE